MDPIALYYPYIHVRDDTWLKYAALYWPKLGRLRPPGYPTRDSIAARMLDDELGWIVDVAPERAAQAVQDPFLQLIEEHAPALRARFGLEQIDSWGTRPTFHDNSNVGGSQSAGPGSPPLDPRRGYVHLSKVRPATLEAVLDSGLAEPAQGRGGTWIGMHPELAGVYMCAVTEQVAMQERVHPITDQTLPHAALSGWTMDRLAEVLLGEDVITAPAARPGDPVDLFVLTAFETVVPANLASVPIDKIVEVRTKFGRELNAFRTYVQSQAEGLTKLTDVRDLHVYQAHIQHEVERKVSDKLAELREKLRSVGLGSASALVNIKLALPAPLALAATAVGVNPVVSGTAAVATAAIGVQGSRRKKRQSAIRESPVGYLFHLGRELDAATLADRVRRSLSRRS